nr:MAG TPA: hypothetical protein [Caudoviricetes sp.]
MTKYVTVNLFDVQASPQTQPLGHTLDEFGALPLDGRWRGDIRLDHVERKPALDGLPSRVLLNFCKRRDVGPGKVGSKAAVQDIVLGQDEDFGEETAAVYVPRKKWLAVLNNRHGAGPSRMAEYFNALDPGNNGRFFDYQVLPKLESDALQRLQSMSGFRALEVTATVDALDASGSRMGRSLAAATRPAHVQTVSVSLRAKKAKGEGRGLVPDAIRRLAQGLLAQDDGVSRLQVKGSDDSADSKDQVIDLLHQKLKQRFRHDELVVHNRRFTLDSRWRLLERALKNWL